MGVKNRVAQAFILSFGILYASACSNSSGGSTSVPSNAFAASCQYSESKQCYEYHTQAVARDNEGFCQDPGKWLSSGPCPTTGRVKGCQVKKDSLKIFTLWTYSSESAQRVEESYCKPGSPLIPEGASTELVNP